MPKRYRMYCVPGHGIGERGPNVKTIGTVAIPVVHLASKVTISLHPEIKLACFRDHDLFFEEKVKLPQRKNLYSSKNKKSLVLTLLQPTDPKVLPEHLGTRSIRYEYTDKRNGTTRDKPIAHAYLVRSDFSNRKREKWCFAFAGRAIHEPCQLGSFNNGLP
jgi:hypothetical protein